MTLLRESAANASSSSGSSRTWAQNIDIAELQKFQLNKNREVTGGASPPDIAAPAQKIDFQICRKFS
jgi:hypothetical protein